jgi:hypothetical protein
MRAPLPVIASLAFCLAACATWDQVAPAPAPPPEAAPAAADAQAEAAAAISAHLDLYQSIDGHLQTETGDSRFVAYFDDGQLRYLAERTDLGPQSSAVAEYYFENGHLFYYAENERAAELDASGVDAVTTRLSFDPDGALLRAERTANGAPAEVADDQVLAVRLHVQFLTLAADEARLRMRHMGGRAFSAPPGND